MSRHVLVEWLTMLIVAQEGGRRRKLSPSQRTVAAPVYPRKNDAPRQAAAGFGTSPGTPSRPRRGRPSRRIRPRSDHSAEIHRRTVRPPGQGSLVLQRCLF